MLCCGSDVSRSFTRDLFFSKDGEYVGLCYHVGNQSFSGLKKFNTNTVWQNYETVIKSISKSSFTEFVGISEDNRFLKYNMDDGSIVEEYEIPTYENIHAIEGKEEFILLGTPKDEEGITIEGTSGAVIAKYAIE